MLKRVRTTPDIYEPFHTPEAMIEIEAIAAVATDKDA